MTTGVNLGDMTQFRRRLRFHGERTINCDANSSGHYIGWSQRLLGRLYPRKMKNTTLPDTLNYNLYTTASRITIWGDGTQGTSTVGPTAISQNGWQATLTVYGRIPTVQDVSADNMRMYLS